MATLCLSTNWRHSFPDCFLWSSNTSNTIWTQV